MHSLTKSIKELSDKKFAYKLFLFFMLFSVISFLLAMFSYDGVSIIKQTFITAGWQQLNNNTQQEILFSLIKQFLFYISFYFLISWLFYWGFAYLQGYIVKFVLKLFKKDMKVMKIVNIFLYASLVEIILRVVVQLVFLLPMYFAFTAIRESLVIFQLILIVISVITGIVVYAYGLKISLKVSNNPFLKLKQWLTSMR